MKKVYLELTQDQAAAAAKGLDVYARLSLGQLEILTEQVRDGTIVARERETGNGRPLSIPEVGRFDALVIECKRLLGMERGASFGIGHRHVNVSGRRSYEVSRVLRKALADERDPNPKFRGTDHDGLQVRWTDDPAPIATIGEARHAAA